MKSPNPKPLSVLLDEIEARNNPWDDLGSDGCVRRRSRPGCEDVPSLVKALRRAEAALFHFTSGWANEQINLAGSKALRDITAILTGEAEQDHGKQDLGK